VKTSVPFFIGVNIPQLKLGVSVKTLFAKSPS
jgi:hypothetical protein